jgi:hypothetical protein
MSTLQTDAAAQSSNASALNRAPYQAICADCSKPTGVPAALPPAGFNPLTATDALLDHYGFPPRPNPRTSPRDYAVWQAAVGGNVRRIVPRQQVTTIRNAPATIVAKTQTLRPAAAQTTFAATSTNWSGYAIQDGLNPFKAANSTIYGVFMVPTVRQAAGACTGGWDYSSMWVGFDGLNSNDVLQAGVEADAYCSNGSKQQKYSAWYEWYPAYAVQVSAPVISPGDLIYVYVWNTGPTTGHYYLRNMTTGAASSLQFTAPAGTQLQGNSMEWVVERPQVDRVLATLASYIASPWYDARALIPSGTKKLTYAPGASPSGELYSITMLDNAGSPISYGETTTSSGYSYVDQQGKLHHLLGSGLWFFDEGSAK